MRRILAAIGVAALAAVPLSAGAQVPPTLEGPEAPAPPDAPPGSDVPGPGSAPETSGRDTAPQTAQQQAGGDVDVRDFEFVPERFEVEPGETVTWFQTGDAPHSVTADDGSFDSHPSCNPSGTPADACMQNGDTYERTFDQEGTFRYYCKVHGGPGGQGMSGVIVVASSGGTAPGGSTAGDPSATDTSGDAGSGAELAQTGGGVLLPLLGGAALFGAGAAALGLLRRTNPRR